MTSTLLLEEFQLVGTIHVLAPVCVIYYTAPAAGDKAPAMRAGDHARPSQPHAALEPHVPDEPDDAAGGSSWRIRDDYYPLSPATASAGTVPPPNQLPRRHRGRRSAQVDCSWWGRKNPSRHRRRSRRNPIPYHYHPLHQECRPRHCRYRHRHLLHQSVPALPATPVPVPPGPPPLAPLLLPPSPP